MPPPLRHAVLQSFQDLTSEVRELWFRPAGDPLEFVPGQWIGIHLPGAEKLVRAYTLADAVSGEALFPICLDRVPGGVGSEYLFGLQPGDTISFAGPLGRFTPPDSPHPYLICLADFTGIVPFRAMLRGWERDGSWPADGVTLFYGSNGHELPYRTELTALASHSSLNLVICPEPPPASILEDPGVRVDAVYPMLCGRREFVQPRRDVLHSRDFGRRQYAWESYD